MSEKTIVHLTRKLSKKVRSAYVKQARKDMKDILDKACEWPLRKRLRLAMTILKGRKKDSGQAGMTGENK